MIMISNMKSEHEIMLARLEKWRAPKQSKTEKRLPAARQSAVIPAKKPLCATNRSIANTPCMKTKIQTSQSTLKKKFPKRYHTSAADNRLSKSPSMSEKLEQWKAQKKKERSATKSLKHPWKGGGRLMDNKPAHIEEIGNAVKQLPNLKDTSMSVVMASVTKKRRSVSQVGLKGHDLPNKKPRDTGIDISTEADTEATSVNHCYHNIDTSSINPAVDHPDCLASPSPEMPDEEDNDEEEFMLHSSLEPMATSPQVSCDTCTPVQGNVSSSRQATCKSVLKSGCVDNKTVSKDFRNVTFTTPLRCSPRLAKVGEGASRCNSTPKPDMRDRLQSWLQEKGKTPSRYSHLLNFQRNTPADRLRRERLKHRMPTPAHPLQPVNGKVLEEDVGSSQLETNHMMEKINSTLSECMTLLNEGCPVDHVLHWLDDICRRLPMVEHTAKYWLCRAMAFEMDDRDYEEVIGVYEEAAEAEAQPIEDIKESLKALVVRIGSNARLTQDNPSSSSPDSSTSTHPSTPSSPDIKAIPVYLRQRLAKFSGLKFCLSNATPRYKRRAAETPYFTPALMITPVRRSVRLETRRSFLPDNLQEHDVCVNSLSDLPTDTLMTEFILRPNRALAEEFDE